ncbi:MULTISPECIES: metallophosphoesterase [unclassified Rhizobium]|uniref:metallophosphoesterase n=1 Tax=unclassified Rhizobium TaxID=2613769 RepID=UPI0006475F05|nr:MULTISPECIES: metallophosphoesterase [unclassified Rhizobium]MBN8952472.1 metallophosphoesterase [Rhizobium tropici]OJY79157.1 MAG: phosphohydrolase [Rhizobium sp. 60-20]RKD67673.1 calcineurin-like phosphoesterase family protein [Rhizobium sp. WW_1]
MTAHTTFVHLTDLHISDPTVKDDHLYSETSKTLVAILADVKRLTPPPRFVIASGDLTNRGDVGSYEELKRIMAQAELDVPVLYALGNHDKRDGFYKAMTDRTEDLGAPYDHAAVIDGIHIIVMDSSHPFKIGGSFEASQFAWLEAELANHPDLPKLMVMHHAPALDANADLEWESLAIADTEKLRRLLEGRNIIGILSGHIHFDRVSNWYGIPVIVGIGQHAATDVLYLHEGLRMLSGASFAIGAVRPSGLTVSFVPQPAERRELHSFSFTDMADIIKKYEEQAALAAAE